MKLLANILTFFVAVSHVGILILEMFFWNHSVGQRIFAMTPEVAAASEVLAMNQGLYNGFLAAGLFWGLLIKRTDIKIFFLTQGLPALIALVFVWLNSRNKEG